MRRSKSALLVCAAGVLAAALSLTGCTEAAPTDAPTPVASTTDAVDSAEWSAVSMTGVGGAEESFDVPEGAESLQVEFACLGKDSYFTISLVAALSSDRSGGCEGTRSYRLPLEGTGPLMLSVTLPEDSHFSLSAEFSAEAFSPDAAIAAACAEMSTMLSLIYNADAGVDAGAVTAEAWQAQIDEAVLVATELETTATGLIGMQAPIIRAGLTAPEVVPGYLSNHQPPTSMDVALNFTTATCNDNGSSITISAQYGG